MDAHHAILYKHFFHAERELKAGFEKVIDVGTAGAGPGMTFGRPGPRMDSRFRHPGFTVTEQD